MCMGYVREIHAWVCDETQNQRDEMMHAWSAAFAQSGDEADAPFTLSSFQLQPDSDAVAALEEHAKERLAPSSAVPVT